MKIAIHGHEPNKTIHTFDTWSLQIWKIDGEGVALTRN